MTNNVEFIIGISGGTGSGKTTIANAIGKYLGIQTISIGEIIKRAAIDNGFQTDVFNLQDFANKIIKTKGFDELRSMIISNAIQNRFIVEGIRHYQLWESLRKISKSNLLIGMNTSDSSRINRIIERDKLTEETAVKIIGSMMETNAKEIISHADIIINESFDINFILNQFI